MVEVGTSVFALGYRSNKPWMPEGHQDCRVWSYEQGVLSSEVEMLSQGKVNVRTAHIQPPIPTGVCGMGPKPNKVRAGPCQPWLMGLPANEGGSKSLVILERIEHELFNCQEVLSSLESVVGKEWKKTHETGQMVKSQGIVSEFQAASFGWLTQISEADSAL